MGVFNKKQVKLKLNTLKGYIMRKMNEFQKIDKWKIKKLYRSFLTHELLFKKKKSYLD